MITIIPGMRISHILAMTSTPYLEIYPHVKRNVIIKTSVGVRLNKNSFAVSAISLVSNEEKLQNK